MWNADALNGRQCVINKYIVKCREAKRYGRWNETERGNGSWEWPVAAENKLLLDNSVAPFGFRAVHYFVISYISRDNLRRGAISYYLLYTEDGLLAVVIVKYMWVFMVRLSSFNPVISVSFVISRSLFSFTLSLNDYSLYIWKSPINDNSVAPCHYYRIRDTRSYVYEVFRDRYELGHRDASKHFLYLSQQSVCKSFLVDFEKLSDDQRWVLKS